MRILVSNDDGFHAEGIQVLAKELRKIVRCGDRRAGSESQRSIKLINAC